MNLKTPVFIAVLSISGVTSLATDIKGRVYEAATKNPLPGATVALEGTTTGAVTDGDGFYSIANVSKGNYTITVSSIGFERISKKIIVNKKSLVFDFSLEETPEELEEVVISAASEATMTSQQPISVTSLDAKTLQVQSASAADVLRISTGVAVRRSGGLGSDASVELGGLSGGAVRIFYDGIPLEYIGAGFDLTNIPVGMIDRIDVYKGVMPIDKGTDALAGGINIVPRNYINDRFEVSYEGGSFNTHRGSLLGSKVLNKNLSLSLKAFANYSDNDYTMDGISVLRQDTVANQIGGGVTIETREEIFDDVRRFHNAHRSAFAEIGIHLHDLPWAESLEYFANISDRSDEVQNGIRITDRAVASAFNESGAILQRIKYKHRFLSDKLEVGYQGIYILGRQRNRDATLVEKNWLGEVIPRENPGDIGVLLPELANSATDRDVDRNSHVHRALASYSFSEHQKLTVTNFFAGLKVEGSDILNRFETDEGVVLDAAAVPFHLDKNIMGLEWNAKWLKSKRLNTIAFAKHYYYYLEGATRPTNTSGVTALPTSMVEETATGYGLGVKYTLVDGFLVRGSFENAYRIPSEIETFGNLITIEPNLSLRPEQSYNTNLGFQWDKQLNPSLRFRVQADGFLRNTTDVIQVRPFGFEGSRNENSGDTRTLGWEASIRVERDDFTRITFNITDQERIFTAFASGSGAGSQGGLDTPFPNTPFFFYNAQGNIGLKTFMPNAADLQLFANYFYVDEFTIVETTQNGRADPSTFVPEQHEVMLGIGYTTKSGKIRLSAQANNLLNNRELFDNFRVNKPGRNVLAKIIYQL